ncbi:MAG: hypothetical protein AB1505_09925, partial [Candidatus Latescibacterota bacterium]
MDRRGAVRRAAGLVVLGTVLGLHGVGEGKEAPDKLAPPKTRQAVAAKLAQRALQDRQVAVSKVASPSARRARPQDLLVAKLHGQVAQRAAKPAAKVVAPSAVEQERSALAKRVRQAQEKREVVPAKPGRGTGVPAAKLAAGGGPAGR